MNFCLVKTAIQQQLGEDARIQITHYRLSEEARSTAITSSNSGDCDVLIICGIGASGIDICTVDHVIFREPLGDWVRVLGAVHQCGREKDGALMVIHSADEQDTAQIESIKKRFEDLKAGGEPDVFTSLGTMQYPKETR